MARLIIVSGPGAGTEHRLEGGRISIGRDPANTIVIGDSLVSKRHAEIIRDEDGGHRIVDVGSSNGTLVNDRQAVDHRLSHNDRIELGECLLRFVIEEEQPAGDEGAKTVLIDDASTRLSIPSDVVAAARSPEPPPRGAVAESTIYISDDDGAAPAAVPPPAAVDPGTGPVLRRKQTNLPVMPILISFIAVMIIIGCVLTWKVVQHSRGEAATAVVPAATPVAGGSAVEPGPASLTGQAVVAAEEAAAADQPQVVEEKNLIAEPPAEVPPATRTSSPPATRATTPPPPARTTTPQPTRTTTPLPPARTTTPPATRTTTPPPTRTTTPPPTRTYTPPPARPREVPPSTGGQTTAGAAATSGTRTTAAPPPAATPARPREIVPDASHGVLHVLSKPVGATIYINEELVGKTNSKNLMSPGKYILRLEHQGQSTTDDVKVKELEVSTFYHDFTPPPPGRDDDDDDDDEDDDKDRKKRDKDDDEDDEDEDEDDEDEDEEEDDKKKKKGFKKKLKDIFG
jgi:pSer/pThr/pTyr-binding forkhead associated (FHA) protein